MRSVVGLGQRQPASLPTRIGRNWRVGFVRFRSPILKSSLRDSELGAMVFYVKARCCRFARLRRFDVLECSHRAIIWIKMQIPNTSL